MSAASGEPEVIHTARWRATWTLYSEAAQMMPASMSHQKGSVAAPQLLESLKDVLAAYDTLAQQRDAAVRERDEAIREMAKARIVATKHAGDAGLLWLILEDQKESGRGGVLPKVHARARKAERENESLRARLAACEGDAARLDWLEATKEFSIGAPYTKNPLWFVYVDDEPYEGAGATLRDAIDATMARDDDGPNDGHARTVNRTPPQDAATTRGEG